MPDTEQSAPSEVAGRWQTDVVHKRDLFSTVERGRFRTPTGAVEAVLRRIDVVPWWTQPIARLLFRHERNALALAGELGIATLVRYGPTSADGAVSMRDSFKATLRMRPDRIVVGELRGGVALEPIAATTSGHGGCMLTLHAAHLGATRWRGWRRWPR